MLISTLRMSTFAMTSEKLQLFYKGSNIATMHTHDYHRAVISGSGQNLCEISSQNPQVRLLATDAQNSTVCIASKSLSPIAYSPYGQDSLAAGSLALPRFTGQWWLPTAIGYVLGSGYRVFNPALMRFFSPDNLSPFEKGGINAYTYCESEPINNIDPSGHFLMRTLKRLKGIHRSQLYSKLNRMEAQRNSGKPLSKENSFGRRKYRELKKLADRDLADSKKRLEHIENIQKEVDKEILANPSAYNEKVIWKANATISAAFEAPAVAHADDLATQELLSEMAVGLYKGKTRYYLPPSTPTSIRQPKATP